MYRALLFGSLSLLVVAGCASVRAESHGVADPVNVVVLAQPPLHQADADLFRKITEGYVQRYVHNGQPLTVRVTLGPASQIMARHDVAALGGYWQIESSYSIPSGHTVPLAGGTYPEVGFLPTVSTGGESIGAGSGYVAGGYLPYFSAGLYAKYTIADQSGKVLESHVVPVSSLMGSFVGWRLQDYHDSGMYIAKRIAKARW